jgi:hypothetical protein
VAPKSLAKTAELDSLFEAIARKYGEHALKDSTVRKTKGRDAVIASCAAVDKLRLLRGETTSIHGTTGPSTPQINVLVVPAATDPGGRVYTEGELRELTSGSGELPTSDGSTTRPSVPH